MTTAERVKLLVRERPDLVPLLKRLLANDCDTAQENAADCDELTRRGLLIRVDRP